MVHNDKVARSAANTKDMDNMSFEDVQAKENGIDDDCDKNPESDCNTVDALTSINSTPEIEMSTWTNTKLQDNALAQLKSDPVEVEYDKENVGGPSNECLLGTAFVSFMSFALLETVAAFAAGSEALMGDSAAMIVDALTYLFNLLAERKKMRFAAEHVLPLTASIYPERARRVFRRDQRKMILQLELVPPLISATVLMIVTAVVLHEAIRVLILDAHRQRSEQGDPNLNLMLGFSIVNLLLDGLNVFCFAKAKHLFGYETVERNNPHQPSTNGAKTVSHQNRSFSDHTTRNNRDYVEVDTNEGSEGSEDDFNSSHLIGEGELHDERGNTNLNMCSAYTVSYGQDLW
jgi:Co/Zn/Cd efflux system component